MPLLLIHGCPTHRLLLFPSASSQGLRFLVPCAITAENRRPRVTHSPSLFPAQKLSVPSPSRAGVSVRSTVWLPRRGQGHSLGLHIHSLLPLLPDSNLFQCPVVSLFSLMINQTLLRVTQWWHECQTHSCWLYILELENADSRDENFSSATGKLYDLG